MNDALRGLPGTVFLMGDLVRALLAQALELEDDLTEIHRILIEADAAVDRIIQQAKAAQQEIDEAPDALKARSVRPT